MWEFPGGKCEPGESLVEALVRELREELAIDAEPTSLLIRVPWSDADQDFCMDVLHVPRWRGTPVPCEGQAVDWFDPDTIDPQSLAPADRPVLDLVRVLGVP